MSNVAKRILLLAITFLALTPFSTAQELPNRNVRFGAPAKSNDAQREDHLIERPQYSLSYNAKTRTPNWVSWCLRNDDIGKSTRGAFEPDPLLPKGFAKVSTQTYTGSGFDRGHMCPAQDRSSKQKDMDATFFTTNIVPQSPNCNQRAWERLESYCRTLTKDHALYISCGPHGVGGEGKNGFAKEIGRVTVPAKVWKVILVLPSEDAEPRKGKNAQIERDKVFTVSASFLISRATSDSMLGKNVYPVNFSTSRTETRRWKPPARHRIVFGIKLTQG